MCPPPRSPSPRPVLTVQGSVLVHSESSLRAGVSQQPRQPALSSLLTEVSVYHHVLQDSEAAQRVVGQVLCVIVADTGAVGESLPAVATWQTNIVMSHSTSPGPWLVIIDQVLIIPVAAIGLTDLR